MHELFGMQPHDEIVDSPQQEQDPEESSDSNPRGQYPYPESCTEHETKLCRLLGKEHKLPTGKTEAQAHGPVGACHQGTHAQQDGPVPIVGDIIVSESSNGVRKHASTKCGDAADPTGESLWHALQCHDHWMCVQVEGGAKQSHDMDSDSGRSFLTSWAENFSGGRGCFFPCL